MTRQIMYSAIQAFACMSIAFAVISCNANSNTEIKGSSTVVSERAVIPDTVIQFLLTSAAKDFNQNQEPAAIDFRNVRIGYIQSQLNDKIYILCGEFLSKENKAWIEFTTIKTSGYEQYIGRTQYCQDATMILTDEQLSFDLKERFFAVSGR